MHTALLALVLANPVVASTKLDGQRHGPDVPGSVEPATAAPVSPGSVVAAGVAWHEDEVVFVESNDRAPNVYAPDSLDPLAILTVETRF